MRQIFTTFALILAVLPVWTGAVQRTNYACEHQTPVRVRCPDHYVINVKYAFYGRLEKSRCGWNENNHCKAGNSRSIIKQNCQNENSCFLKAENNIFGDPCGGVVKYIKLVYDCVPAAGVIRTSFACEHQTPVRVTCPAHYVIDVKYTFYGRQEKSRCGWNDNNRCKAANSPSIIKRSCQHENSCLLRAENGIFGDPCGGVVKYIKFVYQCVPAAGKKRLAIACEHERDVKVNCPYGYVINVYDSFYGRDDLTTCYRYSQTNTNCKANGSHQKIAHTCEHKNSCVLSAKNSVFGDPCGGVRKFIKMSYSCVPQALWLY